jgi:flagellar biosynthesis/type III secretory pathway protein FliH
VLRREEFASKPAFSFQDLEGQAQAVLEQARTQAQRIVTQSEQRARRRAAQLEQEAEPRGFAAGHQQGLEQARAEAAETALQEARQSVTHLTQALTTGLEALEEGKRRLLATAECGLLELALAIARRVCKHDAGGLSEAARANARALLEMVQHEDDLELHLNPTDHDLLRDAADLNQVTNRFAHVEVLADPKVPRGGCVLRARNGTIDATLETQLDRVAKALVERGAEQD